MIHILVSCLDFQFYIATMKSRIIKLTDIPVHQRDGYIYRRLVSQEVAPYNTLHIVVHGTHNARWVVAGIRNYYVIAGQGVFTVETTAYNVASGTLIVIHPGEVYSYTGQMELLEFNIPTDGQIAHEDID